MIYLVFIQIQYSYFSPLHLFNLYIVILFLTEYVYLICQDKRTGRVITIHDNRARLEAEITANSQGERGAIATLLGYGTSK